MRFVPRGAWPSARRAGCGHRAGLEAPAPPRRPAGGRVAGSGRGSISRLAAAALLVAALSVTGGCGADSSSQPEGSTGETLTVSPQNTTLLPGVNRISVALVDAQSHLVTGARGTLEVQGAKGTFETRPLQDIGPQYGNIPIYVTTVQLPQTGSYRYVVHTTLRDGRQANGQAVVSVVEKGPELTVGSPAPSIAQAVLTTPGATLAQLDSGSPPDEWHSATIADGLAQHRPMALYFGEPGFCKSRTCGPTVQILQQLNQQYGSRLLFEHVETHFPAQPDSATAPNNPAFDAFGLTTDPWIFFVNANGIIADRFQGPVTVDELKQAADGTLAGKVPAVDVTI